MTGPSWIQAYSGEPSQPHQTTNKSGDQIPVPYCFTARENVRYFPAHPATALTACTFVFISLDMLFPDVFIRIIQIIIILSSSYSAFFNNTLEK
jgi:hypothetical protein